MILLFPLYRCSFVMKKMYGIKNPRLETKESIEKYINRKYKYTLHFQHYMVDSMFLRKNKIAIPILEVYNKNGKLLLTENQKCNYNILDNAVYSNKIDTSENIKKISLFVPLFKGDVFHLNNSDYYFVLYWTKWSGKVSGNLIKEVYHYYEQHPSLKMSVILVNADYRREWKWAEKVIQ